MLCVILIGSQKAVDAKITMLDETYVSCQWYLEDIQQ